jgi:molybdopterin-binding protein
LTGKVIKLSQRVVNTEMPLEFTGGSQLVSIISKESAKILSLKSGKKNVRDYKSFQCNDSGALGFWFRSFIRPVEFFRLDGHPEKKEF